MENLYTVEKVFSGRLFQIPDYQRGYAWEEQQWRDFLDDLALLEQNRKHFMGTLILHVQDGEAVSDRFGDSYTVHYVVDGQQRLTTIVIFLDVIGEFFKELGEYDDLVTGIHRKYLITLDRNGQPLPKLTLNQDCRDFFHQNILNNEAVQGPTIRSHRLLEKAQAYFRSYLAGQKERLGDEFGPWLEDLRAEVVQRLTLMVYTVDEEADAGILFETMNNRGKPITELEKVKNYLLYLAGKLHLPAEHNLVATVNQTWKHIFESLMGAGLGNTENEDRLLRAHWLMAYDPNPRNWDGSRSIKARFNLRKYAGRHPELLSDLQEYLRTLFNATTAYVDVLRPGRAGAFQNFIADGELHREMMLEARRLARVGALASFLPLLMALRLRHGDDGRAYIEVTKLCEKYAFRVYRWLRLRSNAGQTRLFRLGHDLYRGKVSVTGLQWRLARLILHYASDSAFVARFENPDENWYQWAGLKYFLYEYERSLAAEQRVPLRLEWESVERRSDTVEHILPQTKDGRGYWRKRFPRSLYRRWLHDIGNLTLTLDNSQLGNLPFNDKNPTKSKRGIYRDSVILMESELAGHEDWTPETVQARRERIKQWALERWQVPVPEQPNDEQSEDSSEATAADYRRLLTRISVPRGQKQLYKALYDAGDNGLSNNELVRVMDRRDRHDLTGVFGALGRRINNTAGYGKQARPGIGMVFTIRERPDGQWQYILRPEMREVLEEMDPPWLHEMVR